MPYRTAPDDLPRYRKPGGTRGGGGQFLAGLAMLIAGGYLFLDSIMVTSNYASLWGFGYGSFGLSLVPVFIGVILLFMNGKSVAGWVLTGGGVIIILAGVIARLTVYTRRLSLFDLLLILVLIAGGIGLMARSFRDQ